MRNYVNILAVLAVPVMLAACETTTGQQPLVGSSYRIELTERDSSQIVSADSLDRLRAFLTGHQADMQDDILFSWNRQDQAANDLLRVINKDLRGLGFIDLYEHPAPLAAQPGQVVVTLRRYQASVPGCDNPQAVNSYANGPFYGFGCASLTNLTQMVADPRDLQRGRDLTPAQASILGVGYQRIQIDEPKELQGGITEIGGGDE